MKKYITFIFFLLICVGTHASTQSDLNDIIARAPSNVNIGVKVQSMENENVIYSLNADRYYIPASTQKTLTAAAALLYLGKSFEFKTTLYHTGKIRADGTLDGNVYFKFSGDPTLTTDDLRGLIAELSKLGVKKINGSVYLDNTLYDAKAYGSGWMWDDQNDCYSAPLNAIIINHNCFDIDLIAGRHVGSNTRIEGDNELMYTPVINQVVTRNFTANDNSCLLDVNVDPNNNYYLTGCVTPGSPAQTLSFAIRYVEPFAKQVITGLFKAAHITVRGYVSFAPVPVAAHETAAHYSLPLANLITIMLKQSDNLIADTLFKTLGAFYFQGQGNWNNGARAVTAILQQYAKVDLSDDAIVDGAGLSRYNLVTPDDFSQLLDSVYHNPNMGGAFIAGLPIAGVDGTLANKVNGRDIILRSNIQAKTGSMTGVLALVGYVYTKQNHILSFVIMINNFPGKVYPYFDLEMRIAEYLIRHE